MVGGDVVLDLKGAGGADLVRHRGGLGKFLDIRSAQDFDLVHLVHRGGSDDHIVIDEEVRGHLDGVAIGILARVGDDAGQRGYRRDLGGYQIDLCVLGSAAAEEVAVKGAQGNALRVRRLSHADAGTAGALKHSRARRDDVGQRAVLGEHVQHLLRAGCDGEGYAVGDGLALEDMRDLHQVGVAGVGAGADAHLVDLHALELGERLDRVGRVGTGGEGSELAEVDHDVLVIDSVVVGLELGIGVLAALRLQEGEGVLVGREDRGGSAQLGAHVGDGRALRDGERFHTFAGILDDLADAALDGQDAQHFEDDVLRADVLLQLAGQLDFDHLRHGDVVLAAAHRDRYVEAAGADRQHADAAAGGGVGVGADERLAGNREALEMHLMTDAVARTGEVDAVLLAHRLNEAMVVGVLKARLQGVVVDIGDRALGANAVYAHRLKFKIRHRAGGVLCECLVDTDTDVGALYHLAGDEVVLNNLFSNSQSHNYLRFLILKCFSIYL